MNATSGNGTKKLMFLVEDDGIYLYINDTLIIPFRDLEEWNKFAHGMLGMVPEMTENYPHIVTG
jgi:hypothetical protein